MYFSLNAIPQLQDDVLYDDRTGMTIGRRQLEARRTGYPYVVILGKSATELPPRYEVYVTKTNSTLYLNENELINLLIL